MLSHVNALTLYQTSEQNIAVQVRHYHYHGVRRVGELRIGRLRASALGGHFVPRQKRTHPYVLSTLKVASHVLGVHITSTHLYICMRAHGGT